MGNDIINPKDTPIEVVSILSGEHLKFVSFHDMKVRIDNNTTLKAWFKNHLNNYSDLDISAMKLIKKERNFSHLYQDILKFNIEKADALVCSPDEVLLFDFFQRIKDISVYFSPPSLLMGPITGGVYESILAASASFFQSAISDTEQEYRIYLKESVINVVAEVLSSATSQVASKILAKAVKLYVMNKFLRKSLHINDAIKDFFKK